MRRDTVNSCDATVMRVCPLFVHFGFNDASRDALLEFQLTFMVKRIIISLYSRTVFVSFRNPRIRYNRRTLLKYRSELDRRHLVGIPEAPRAIVDRNRNHGTAHRRSCASAFRTGLGSSSSFSLSVSVRDRRTKVRAASRGNSELTVIGRERKSEREGSSVYQRRQSWSILRRSRHSLTGIRSPPLPCSVVSSA